MKPDPADSRVGVPEFDTMEDAAAEAVIRPSCASERWVSYLVRTRPHHTLGLLMSASDDAVLLDWPDIEQALAPLAHTWASARRRRDAMAGPGSYGGTPPEAGVPPQIKAAQREYQDLFGHPFLSAEPGGSTSDILRQLELRLGHPPAVERRVVRAELRKIVRNRLTATFHSGDGP